MNRIINTLAAAAAFTATAAVTTVGTAHAGVCDNGVCETYISEGDSFGNSNFGAGYGFDLIIENKAGQLATVQDDIDEAAALFNSTPMPQAMMYLSALQQFQVMYDGIENNVADDYMHGSASGGADATVFGLEVDILYARGYAELDDSQFDADITLSVLGSDVNLVGASTSEINLYEVEMTFIDTSMTMWAGPVPLTVGGEVTGVLGINGSIDASDGIELGVTPYANLSAGASVGVGMACASAGVRGELELITAELPSGIDFSEAGCGIQADVYSDLELSTLSGTVELYADACGVEWSHELVSWNGITETIPLLDTGFCI